MGPVPQGEGFVGRIGRGLSRRVRQALAALLLVLGAALVFLVWFGDTAERYTSGKRPEQFYAELDGDLLDDFGGVFGIAHNSGDDLGATRQALRHGADVIEIDVVTYDDRLFAAHDSPLRFLGKRFFRGPSLEEVWKEAATAEVVKLDLKESGAGYLDLVVAFVNEHRDGDIEIVAASARTDVLERLRDDAPHVIRLLSVSSASGVERLRTDRRLRGLIDGVTIREDRLHGRAAEWLEREGLLVVAWVVNEAPRLNELVRAGVDGITTDNLAIMTLLGAQERHERRLSDRSR